MSGIRELTIYVPAGPPREINPNWQPLGRGVDYIRQSIAKDYAYLIMVSAISARNEWEREYVQRWGPLRTATILIKVILGPHQQAWDDANLIAGLKKATDSLTMPRKDKKGNDIPTAEILADDAANILTWEKPRYERGTEGAMYITIKGE